MKGKKVIHNSNSNDEYGTPEAFIETIKSYFGIKKFDLDVAATKENAKAKRFYTKEDNALSKTWRGGIVWCNPPYSLADEFVDKAIEEIDKNVEVVYLLLPARTDSKWFHKLITSKSCWFYFIKGRIKFDGAKDGAPFPSILIKIKRYYLEPNMIFSLSLTSKKRGFNGKKKVIY